MSVSIIAAVAKNNVIGKRNDLPWYLPEDLKRFKKLTLGHTVVMGRNTYESIFKRLGKPLPERRSVVITSHTDFPVPEGVKTSANLKDALDKNGSEQIFLIGGQRIFEEGLPYANTLYLTELHQDYDGDVYFPNFDKDEWNREVEGSFPDYDFVKYIRKNLSHE